jgi:hypothetical protein
MMTDDDENGSDPHDREHLWRIAIEKDGQDGEQCDSGDRGQGNVSECEYKNDENADHCQNCLWGDDHKRPETGGDSFAAVKFQPD